MICISISSKPGRFGTIVHNAGYKAVGLDWYYQACAVKELDGVIQGIRSLKIRGCSISMPFKEQVIKYLDKIDPIAKKVGAVNTIVNKNGKLIGYNTDVLGAKESLKRLKPNKNSNFLVLGAGGGARAVIIALKELHLNKISISGRSFLKTKKLGKKFKIHVVKWEDRENCKTDFLINATPIGMKPNISAMPVSKKFVSNLKGVMDLVINPPLTNLIKNSKSLKIKNSDGLIMALYQAIAQFELYTGINPPVKIMKNAVKKLYMEKNEF